MKTIKKLKDLHNLTTSDPKVSDTIIQHLKEFFLILSEALGPETSADEFTLEDHGYLVLLEQGDDLRNLKTVGLKPNQGGLLGSTLEYVEIETLSDGKEIYKLAILYDNDYMMFFYLEPNTFDKEIEDWINDQL